MDKKERNRILTSSKLLKAREDSLAPWVDTYSDMSSDEKSKLLCELTAIHLRDEKRNEELMAKIDELIEGNRQMSDLKAMLAESEKKEKEVRLYRQDKEYRTMTADKSICHECDITKLPKDAIIRRYFRYLNTFWIQLFAYTHDGSYTIDNSITERFIHPLAGERKNSLFFGSGKIVYQLHTTQ